MAEHRTPLASVADDDALLDAVRGLPDTPLPPLTPPPDLWGRIAAAVDAERTPSLAVEPDRVDDPSPTPWAERPSHTAAAPTPWAERSSHDDPSPTPWAERPSYDEAAPAPRSERPSYEEASPAPLADIVPLRRRRLPVLTAAAAAVVVAAVGIGVVIVSRGGESTETVAQSALADLASSADVGSATLIADGDALVLRVEAVATPADGEFLELWLVDEAVTEPISLGRYDGAGDYVVPASVDPASYPIVDISTEPDDGNAAHSGASVVRGVLDL